MSITSKLHTLRFQDADVFDKHDHAEGTFPPSILVPPQPRWLSNPVYEDVSSIAITTNRPCRLAATTPSESPRPTKYRLWIHGLSGGICMTRR